MYVVIGHICVCICFYVTAFYSVPLIHIFLIHYCTQSHIKMRVHYLNGQCTPKEKCLQGLFNIYALNLN